MRCPGCDSEQTRKLAAVWEEGSYTEVSTAKTTVKGQSNYFGGGQMGVISNRQKGTTRTTTSGMTELAKRAARPGPETPLRDALVMLGGGAVAIFFGGIVVAAIVSEPLAFVLMPVAAALLVWRVFVLTSRGLQFNRSELPGLLAHWERSWWCTRCGDIFAADRSVISEG
jgi:hypothetical protein